MVGMMDSGYGGMMSGMYGYYGFGWLFQILILVLFFFVIWWVLRSSGNFGFKTSETAVEILKKRLAAGDISEKEYQKLKKEIEG